MKISDIVADANGKTLSHTKIWSNIAYLAGTYKFITTDVNGDIWLIYLGVVGSAQVASKYLSLKYKGGNND
ncbi:MAG: hypothetical protein IE909_12180 [Campylobacterales bacterium]|nr:hypothetical protein [Campylobacterales bacterium]